MGLLDRLFYPPRETNNFTLGRYVSDLEQGNFRDVFNLGITEAGGGQWLLKDFTQEPNAIFAGNMGSGKSVAACYTMVTWLLANSDKTVMFVVDVVKSATDYSELFKFPQVYPITSDGGRDVRVMLERVIDMVFSEAMARKEIFSENQAISVKDYELKTKKPMARIVIMMEEFHAIPYQIFEFDKNFKKEHTVANKFHQLMRIGRSYGIFICAASQKTTKSDIPSEVVPNFTQKQIFKVSQGEANYVLGHSGPAELTSSQKGRCYTDYGLVQFPYMQKQTQEALLKKYVKPLQAENAYLTPKLIREYLDGKQTKELYKLKKTSELAEAMGSFDGELVLRIIHEKLGNQVEAIDSKTDDFGVCMVVTNPNKERFVVLYKEDTKIGVKTMNRLNEAKSVYDCPGALLYCLGENLAPTVYNMAKEFNIRVYDHEDIRLIARQIDAGKIQTARHLQLELANTDEVPEWVGPKSRRRTPARNEELDLQIANRKSDLDAEFFSEDREALRSVSDSKRRRTKPSSDETK